MQCHVLAVEYPGYGLYKSSKPDEAVIKEDAVIIYDYVTQCLGIEQKNIILFGRSMGSGPCSYLASIREPYALLLMSPYTSIQNAAKSILGWASFISFIVYEKFRNIDAIKRAQCPVFLVHGKMDTLIPYIHSEQLYGNCPRETYLHIPSSMDHNEFSFEIDLIEPIKDFFNRVELKKKAILKKK